MYTIRTYMSHRLRVDHMTKHSIHGQTFGLTGWICLCHKRISAHPKNRFPEHHICGWCFILNMFIYDYPFLLVNYANYITRAYMPHRLWVYHMPKHCMYGRTGQNRANLSVPQTGPPHIQKTGGPHITSVVDNLSLTWLPTIDSKQY